MKNAINRFGDFGMEYELNVYLPDNGYVYPKDEYGMHSTVYYKDFAPTGRWRILNDGCDSDLLIEMVFTKETKHRRSGADEKSAFFERDSVTDFISEKLIDLILKYPIMGEKLYPVNC
jgi:hypothetical protein